MKGFLVMSEYNNYKLDFNTITIDNIKSEEEAFSILLGFEPTYFSQFMSLEKRRTTEPKNDDGSTAFTQFLQKDKAFHKGYQAFITEEYKGWGNYTAVIDIYQKAVEQDFWSKDDKFTNYLHKLHDTGFIFKDEIYNNLAPIGIQQEYSKNGWATEFYKNRIQDGCWTLKEALYLYKGIDPKNIQHPYHDLSQNPYNLRHNTDPLLAWNTFDNDYTNINAKLRNHVSSGESINIVERKGGAIFKFRTNEFEDRFKPKDIVEWLMENTEHIPPKPLLRILDIRNTGTNNSVQRTAGAETECKRWLKKLMEDNLFPPNNKKIYREEAALKHKTGIRAFDRAWANAIEETGRENWAMPGRKKQS